MAELTPDLARRLLEETSDGIVICDPQGIVHYWNRGAERIFGLTAERVVGAALDVIIPENLRARHWAGWNVAIRDGRSKYAEGQLLAVPALHRDGRRISIEFSMQLVKDADGSVEWIAACIRDVTDRYQREIATRRELAALKAETGRTT